MSHALPYAANCSMLFTELPLLERPAAAKEAGFCRDRVLVALAGPAGARRTRWSTPSSARSGMPASR